MRKFFVMMMMMAVTGLCLTACGDDDSPSDSVSTGTVVVSLTGISGDNSNIEITLRGASTFTEKADADGKATFNVTPGIYEATASGTYANNGSIYTANGTAGQITVMANQSIDVTIDMKEAKTSQIVIKEIPYQVNRTRLLEQLADLIKEKKLPEISNVHDGADRHGIDIIIELKQNAIPQVVVNKLFKHTQLQVGFGVIMLALVDGVPRVLSLKEVLHYYIKHQEDVITRRTKYDLNKAEERAHILAGLLKALDVIDEIIKIIRASANTAEAKTNLIEAFGFSDAQAQAIVDMRLRALTGLERERLQAEFDDLQEKIKEYKAILADRKVLLGVVKEEISLIAEKYGGSLSVSAEGDLFTLGIYLMQQ